jgi:formimidoylglutamase
MTKKKSQTWSYIGVSDDLGVYHVGGRMGAAQGPDAFWRIFKRMSGRLLPLQKLQAQLHLKDWSGPNSEHLEQSAKAIEKLHRDAGLSVVVGGGHDHGAAHLKGVRDGSLQKNKRPPRIGCINIDAHLDLRPPNPEITSGSPFYVAIENGWIKGEDLVEFGIQSQSNAESLWKYAKAKKVRVIEWPELRNASVTSAFKKELKRLEKRCDVIVISLDLDALAQAYSPGVSAPQAEGFTSQEVMECLEIAGRSPQVTSLGIFELNPIFDADDQSARVAATGAYRWLEQKLTL